jgi:PAS domain-containing protein
MGVNRLEVGQPVYCEPHGSDVSARNGAPLPRLEDLNALIEGSPVATVMISLVDHRICVANNAFAELVGSPPSTVLALRATQVWDGDDEPLASAALCSLSSGAVGGHPGAAAQISPEKADRGHVRDERSV